MLSPLWSTEEDLTTLSLKRQVSKALAVERSVVCEIDILRVSVLAGLANPAPIISTFIMDPTLAQSVRLDGVCTVVDAKHVSSHLDRRETQHEENEASAQVAYADRLILNKKDLISDNDMAALKDRIRAMNGLATIQTAQKSEVPVNYVLGIGGYALDEVSKAVCSSCLPLGSSQICAACMIFTDFGHMLCTFSDR